VVEDWVQDVEDLGSDNSVDDDWEDWGLVEVEAEDAELVLTKEGK